MTDFDRALTHVLQAEGGYVDHPDDPGGATNYGITQGTYTAWLATQGKGSRPVKHIARWEVETIYRSRYWIPAKCERMEWPINMAHFDGAVNLGVSGAVKVLQRALGVTPDGKIGPVTLGAIARVAPDELLHRLLWERTDYYREICNRRPASRTFLLGWLNRLANIREAA